MDSATVKGIDGSEKERLAAWLVRAQIRKDLENLKNQGGFERLDSSLVDIDKSTLNGLPAKQEDPSKRKKYNKDDLKVCIIGAGAAGLYAAHLLQFIGVPFEILEANPKRVGGRLYTHRFSDTDKLPHDYYDVGAMRYPDSSVMFRTFRLFNEAGIQPRLVPYYLQGPNQPTRYNDITKIVPKVDLSNEQREKDVEKLDDAAWAKKYGTDPDPFLVSIKNKGPVPNSTVRNPGIILDKA